jgi:hypothetical protein
MMGIPPPLVSEWKETCSVGSVKGVPVMSRFCAAPSPTSRSSVASLRGVDVGYLST